MLILRDLLVRGESRDLLEALDSRVFQDPRVPLVSLASPESRYKLKFNLFTIEFSIKLIHSSA